MKRRDTLTQKQQKVFEVIKSYVLENGESPTLKELADILGLSSLRTVTQYLESLERKNLIKRDRYSKRGIKLVEDQYPFNETIQVPVFASAGCGDLSVIANRNFDEYISVSKNFISGENKKDLFVIKAVGDSMVDAGIKNGDFVLVEATEDIKNNDIVVAVIDDFVVIKKITFANNAIILNPVSHNPQYHPIILDKNFKIFGKFIRIIKLEINKDIEIIMDPE